jgi:hypothetical protein
MRTTILFSLLLSWNAFAHADESCGMRAAKLFASGQSQPLAALFSNDPAILPELTALSERVGHLENLKEVAAPRFAGHRRMTVQARPAPASINYAGHWINAESGKLGPVQLHVAAASGSECKLLALHVDFPGR